MKANELRLGNYLQAKNRIVTVTKILDINNVGIGSGDPYLVSGNTPCLKPIPLTEEWLLKFGFIQEDDYLELQVYQDLSIIYVGYLALMINGVVIHINNTESDTVHQLQNLYFALTGEELTI